MNPEQMGFGLKVHYVPAVGPAENGRVKTWTQERAFVVYKCGGEWERFADFTACATSLEDLRLGWVGEKDLTP